MPVLHAPKHGQMITIIDNKLYGIIYKEGEKWAWKIVSHNNITSCLSGNWHNSKANALRSFKRHVKNMTSDGQKFTREDY